MRKAGAGQQVRSQWTLVCDQKTVDDPGDPLESCPGKMRIVRIAIPAAKAGLETDANGPDSLVLGKGTAVKREGTASIPALGWRDGASSERAQVEA